MQTGDQIQLSLDALIQVPSGQDWGETRVRLSGSVGRSQGPMMMRAMESAAVLDAPDSVTDGVWQYQFPDAMTLVGGEPFSLRLWTKTAQVQRVHAVSFGLSGQRPAQPSRLSAQRRWLLENSESEGLGVALLPGRLRINHADAPHALVGTANLPGLAPGAAHWIGLGQSQAVSGTLEMQERRIDGAEIHSQWRLALENSSDESVVAQVSVSAPRLATLKGIPDQVVLAPKSKRTFDLALTEPSRR